jgi:hypothetical protein
MSDPSPLPASNVQDGCTPGGVIAGSGALARGLARPAFHGGTYRATLVAGVVLLLLIAVAVALALTA